MLYNINNNNYISVLDIQLWMMQSLNLLQGSLCLSKLLITKLYIYMYLYVLYVKSNQSNHIN